MNEFENQINRKIKLFDLDGAFVTEMDAPPANRFIQVVHEGKVYRHKDGAPPNEVHELEIQN